MYDPQTLLKEEVKELEEKKKEKDPN